LPARLAVAVGPPIGTFLGERVCSVTLPVPANWGTSRLTGTCVTGPGIASSVRPCVFLCKYGEALRMHEDLARTPAAAAARRSRDRRWSIMNPWIAKTLILAASVVMVVIRAPHGRRSRGVKVARSC